jgi:hypothetical protein
MASDETISFHGRLENIEEGFAHLWVDGTQVTLPAYLLPPAAKAGDGVHAVISLLDPEVVEEQERSTSSILRDRLEDES